MDFSWFSIISAIVVTGMVAGVLAGLLGVGGGIVIVPVLFIVFQMLGISAATAMSVATGTSLVIIIATSISSIRAHHQKGNIDSALLKVWAPFIAIGAVAGALVATNVGGAFASAVFGVIAILVAMNMLFRAKSAALWQALPAKPMQGLIGCFIGAVSVVMGIGGGTLSVSVLTSCNYPTHKAVGTSAAFGLIIAVPGALLMLLLAATPVDAPMATFGFVNLAGAALIMPLSVAMAPVGVYLGSKLDGITLKRLFAVFLFLSAARMLYQSMV